MYLQRMLMFKIFKYNKAEELEQRCESTSNELFFFSILTCRASMAKLFWSKGTVCFKEFLFEI